MAGLKVLPNDNTWRLQRYPNNHERHRWAVTVAICWKYFQILLPILKSSYIYILSLPVLMKVMKVQLSKRTKELQRFNASDSWSEA